jgi:tetratricopeptide (TPR) repeat protein
MGDRAALRSAALLLALVAASARAQEPSEQAPDDGAEVEAPPAEAAPAETLTEAQLEARTVMARADALFEAENFSAALAEYERAYELAQGRPTAYMLLYNVGLCYERLFRYDRALEYYERYLEEGGPEADGRDEVLGTMRALENLLGTVRVRVNVASASVWIDEREVGTAPGEIRVPGGRHTIELRAAEHLPLQREFQVSARATIDLDLELEPIPEPSRGISPAWFYVSTGAGVAALIGGVVAGSIAVSLHDAAIERATNDDPSDDHLTTERTGPEIADFTLAADLAFGGALLFAVTATILYFMTDWGGGEETAERAGSPFAVRW